MNFKIGDRVRIIKNVITESGDFDSDGLIGDVGIVFVIENPPNENLSIGVELGNHIIYFAPDELEIVND